MEQLGKLLVNCLIKEKAKALDKQIGDLFISDEVIGFVKFQGTTYEINSIDDIKRLLSEIDK